LPTPSSPPFDEATAHEGWASMYAVTVAEPGGSDVLRWTEVPDPEPVAGEVLIDVAATAVNRADLLQRQGHYPPPPGASPYLGLECSGRIAALGTDVTGYSVGERVCALLSGGGYAERVAVPAGQLLPLPHGMDLPSAASLPEAACTVESNVFELARLRAGETLLVHGGAGGVGTFAIQVATARGARVLTTARSEHHDRLRTLGADACFDYRGDDFVELTLALTNGRGADVILDNMGAAYLDRNLRALAPDGRLATIGLQGGRQGALDLNRLMQKRGQLTATTLRARPGTQKAAIVAAVRDRVWPLIDAGRIRAVVHALVPLPEAARAHALLEAGGHVGKVVLTVPNALARMGG
jgi:putative PIG3 family NAD(P)H quinone oxidoreductase